MYEYIIYFLFMASPNLHLCKEPDSDAQRRHTNTQTLLDDSPAGSTCYFKIYFQRRGKKNASQDDYSYFS